MEWDANVQAFSVILTLCAFLLCVRSNGICNIYSLFMFRVQRSILFVIYYFYQFVRYFPGIFKIRRDRLWRILFYTTNDRGTLCVGWFLRERWKCENLRCVRCASYLCCFFAVHFSFSSVQRRLYLRQVRFVLFTFYKQRLCMYPVASDCFVMVAWQGNVIWKWFEISVWLMLVLRFT